MKKKYAVVIGADHRGFELKKFLMEATLLRAQMI